MKKRRLNLKSKESQVWTVFLLFDFSLKSRFVQMYVFLNVDSDIEERNKQTVMIKDQCLYNSC